MSAFGPGFSQNVETQADVSITNETTQKKKQNNSSKTQIDQNSASDKTYARRRIIRQDANSEGLVAYEPEEVTHIFFLEMFSIKFIIVKLLNQIHEN